MRFRGASHSRKKWRNLTVFSKKIVFLVDFFEKPTAGCDLGERYAPEKIGDT